jgi:hypothetical protein
MSWRWLATLRTRVAEIRRDLSAPIPGDEHVALRKRIHSRGRLLLTKYGWRVIAIILVYYVVRDVLLYIIVPYLVAERMLKP